jgi:hypothetical protein
VSSTVNVPEPARNRANADASATRTMDGLDNSSPASCDESRYTSDGR